MVSRRVFVIWVHPLFHSAMRLLLDHPAIEMVGSDCEYATAQTQMETIQPDTIIIEATGDDATARTRIGEILDNSHWHPRVVRLSMEDNELSIYHRHHRVMTNSQDLLRMIQED